MQKVDEIKKAYLKLKDYIDEAGPFFRQKANYSHEEQIAFIVDFYTIFVALVKLFEEQQALQENTDKQINISVGKVSINKKFVEQEFESAVCVIYFNLSKEDISILEERAKKSPKESLILKKLFEKYLSA